MAFDYGEVRIGVAMCDPDGILASPLPTITNNPRTLNESLTALISEFTPIRIFVGLPVNMSGSAGESAQKAEYFAALLRELFPIEVVLVDERLSTVSAQKRLKEAGVSSKDSKKYIDSMAAVEILEQGLLREQQN